MKFFLVFTLLMSFNITAYAASGIISTITGTNDSSKPIKINVSVPCISKKDVSLNLKIYVGDKNTLLKTVSTVIASNVANCKKSNADMLAPFSFFLTREKATEGQNKNLIISDTNGDFQYSNLYKLPDPLLDPSQPLGTNRLLGYAFTYVAKNSVVIDGWACKRGNPKSLELKFYIENDSTPFKSVTATLSRPGAVPDWTHCQTLGFDAYGFSEILNASELKQTIGKKVVIKTSSTGDDLLQFNNNTIANPTFKLVTYNVAAIMMAYKNTQSVAANNLIKDQSDRAREIAAILNSWSKDPQGPDVIVIQEAYDYYNFVRPFLEALKQGSYSYFFLDGNSYDRKNKLAKNGIGFGNLIQNFMKDDWYVYSKVVPATLETMPNLYCEVDSEDCEYYFSDGMVHSPSGQLIISKHAILKRGTLNFADEKARRLALAKASGVRSEIDFWQKVPPYDNSLLGAPDFLTDVSFGHIEIKRSGDPVSINIFDVHPTPSGDNSYIREAQLLLASEFIKARAGSISIIAGDFNSKFIGTLASPTYGCALKTLLDINDTRNLKVKIPLAISCDSVKYYTEAKAQNFSYIDSAAACDYASGKSCTLSAESDYNRILDHILYSYVPNVKSLIGWQNDNLYKFVFEPVSVKLGNLYYSMGDFQKSSVSQFTPTAKAPLWSYNTESSVSDPLSDHPMLETTFALRFDPPNKP